MSALQIVRANHLQKLAQQIRQRPAIDLGALLQPPEQLPTQGCGESKFPVDAKTDVPKAYGCTLSNTARAEPYAEESDNMLTNEVRIWSC